MAKRAAEDEQTSPSALKSGERPVADNGIAEGEEFEDEFEDEYESEDEVLEAGVDGRPDEEREAEERANGEAKQFLYVKDLMANNCTQAPWKLTSKPLFQGDIN